MALQKHPTPAQRKREKGSPGAGEGVFVVERRKHPRIKIELPMDYFLAGRRESHGGIVTNASRGGLLVHLMEEIKIGASMNIGILFVRNSELNLIKAKTKVVWSKMANKKTGKEYRYGLTFQSFGRGDLNKLKTLLKEV